jgi:hypothetical protein
MTATALPASRAERVHHILVKIRHQDEQEQLVYSGSERFSQVRKSSKPVGADRPVYTPHGYACPPARDLKLVESCTTTSRGDNQFTGA